MTPARPRGHHPMAHEGPLDDECPDCLAFVIDTERRPIPRAIAVLTRYASILRTCDVDPADELDAQQDAVHTLREYKAYFKPSPFLDGACRGRAGFLVAGDFEEWRDHLASLVSV